MSRSRSALALGTVAVLTVLVLTGCTQGEPVGPSSSAPASSAPADAEPSLSAVSTTEQAFASFDLVNRRVVDAGGATDGRTMVDALVTASFDKAALQVTPDTTSIGREADSVQFSVLWGDDCLIGQVGSTGYASQVAPVLGDGACLVGTTHTIDW